MIDAARLGVGRDELVGKLRDGFHGAKAITKTQRGQATLFYEEARKPRILSEFSGLLGFLIKTVPDFLHG